MSKLVYSPMKTLSASVLLTKPWFTQRNGGVGQGGFELFGFGTVV
jgi:hypothetical protein